MPTVHSADVVVLGSVEPGYLSHSCVLEHSGVEQERCRMDSHCTLTMERSLMPTSQTTKYELVLLWSVMSYRTNIKQR